VFEDLQRFISEYRIDDTNFDDTIFEDLFQYVSDLWFQVGHDVEALHGVKDRGSFKNSVKAKRGLISEGFKEDDTRHIDILKMMLQRDYTPPPDDYFDVVIHLETAVKTLGVFRMMPDNSADLYVVLRFLQSLVKLCAFAMMVHTFIHERMDKSKQEKAKKKARSKRGQYVIETFHAIKDASKKKHSNLTKIINNRLLKKNKIKKPLSRTTVIKILREEGLL